MALHNSDYHPSMLANYMHDFDVVLLEDETGGYVAIVPALSGCHTQGDILAEVFGKC